jgi:cancer susceptibility candidate protein 1
VKFVDVSSTDPFNCA